MTEHVHTGANGAVVPSTNGILCRVPADVGTVVGGLGNVGGGSG